MWLEVSEARWLTSVFCYLHPTDVLVNNAAEQHCKPSIMDITPQQLDRTFRTNIFAYFYLTRAFDPSVCWVPFQSVTRHFNCVNPSHRGRAAPHEGGRRHN